MQPVLLAMVTLFNMTVGCKRFASEKGTPIALQRLGRISLELSAASGFSLHLTAWYLYTYMYNSNKFYSIQQPSKNRKVFPECFRSCYMYFTFSGVTLVVLYLGPFLIDDHPKILLPPASAQGLRADKFTQSPRTVYSIRRALPQTPPGHIGWWLAKNKWSQQQ